MCLAIESATGMFGTRRSVSLQGVIGGCRFVGAQTFEMARSIPNDLSHQNGADWKGALLRAQRRAAVKATLSRLPLVLLERQFRFFSRPGGRQGCGCSTRPPGSRQRATLRQLSAPEFSFSTSASSLRTRSRPFRSPTSSRQRRDAPFLR